MHGLFASHHGTPPQCPRLTHISVCCLFTSSSRFGGSPSTPPHSPPHPLLLLLSEVSLLWHFKIGARTHTCTNAQVVSRLSYLLSNSTSVGVEARHREGHVEQLLPQHTSPLPPSTSINVRLLPLQDHTQQTSRDRQELRTFPQAGNLAPTSANTRQR